MVWGSAIATQALKSRTEAVPISLLKDINKPFDKQ